MSGADGLLDDTGHEAAAFDHLFTSEHRSIITLCVRMLNHIVGPQLAEALSPITALNYSRTAPALPDRTVK